MFRIDSRAAHYVLLVLLWASLCLPNLGGPSLWDIDEGLNAECSREMQDSGNLIVPTFNYQLRDAKPVLLYWLQMACSHVVGVNEWSARLPSAMMFLLTVIIVYEFGRRAFGVGSGVLAAVVLVTSLAPLGAAHFANPDATLLAFSTLTLALFWHHVVTEGKGSLFAVGLAAGMATMAKGPIGLLMPAGIAMVFLLWQRRLRYLIDLRIGLLLLAFILVAGPWYGLVTAETKGAWLKAFLYKQHLERVTSAMEGHSGPFFFYLPVLLVGMFPWSIFMGGMIWHSWGRLTQGHDTERMTIRLLVVWLLAVVVFFSVVSTKLPNYILPAYPAAALLTGHFLARWRRGEVVMPRWWMHVSFASLALVGIAVTVGLLVLSGAGQLAIMRGRSYPGLVNWAWLGLMLLVFAALACWLYHHERRNAVLVSLVGGTVAFTMLVATGAIRSLEPLKAPRELARSLPKDHLDQELRLASFDWFQPSIVFYAQREVERPTDMGQAMAFLTQPLPAYLFVPQDTWKRLEPQVPATCRVVTSRRDMYTGRVVLLVTNQ